MLVCTVDGLATGAVVVCEVTALTHQVCDDSVEQAALRKCNLVNAQSHRRPFTPSIRIPAFSPVHRARKFSAVLGASPKQVKTELLQTNVQNRVHSLQLKHFGQPVDNFSFSPDR